MLIIRKPTKEIKIGNVKIGNGNSIAVQSMCNTKTQNILETVKQIKELEAVGCAIVRVAVMDMEAAKAICEIKKEIQIPLVADIHFDYKLALEAIAAGVDKIRINPGNIGSDERVKAVADACRQKNIPIRIGVNSGSLEKHILEKYLHPTAEALVESALYHISLLNKFDFDDIVVSIKSSNVPTMVSAFRLLSEQCSYPLHLGVTEAGTERMGLIKSSIGIGSLLLDGIGDTIRVSLTAPVAKEVTAGYDILKAVGLHNSGAELISCPTCGRTEIDLIGLANKIEELLTKIDKPIKVAVMGCAVNGPGEAKEADIGVAGGKGEGLLFKKGKIIKKVPEDKIIEELLREIEGMN
jgi:(E)-4-hydroxy-3-methylbut-2-enyl-diphosphate synthase